MKLKTLIVLLLITTLLYQNVSANSYYVNNQNMFKIKINLNADEDNFEQIFLHNTQLTKSMIDDYTVYGFADNFNNNKKYVTYPLPLKKKGKIILDGIFYYPIQIADWDVGFTLSPKTSYAFESPEGVGFVSDYRPNKPAVYNVPFIIYLNKDYESSTYYHKSLVHGWVTLKVIINPYDGSVVMRVLEYGTYYAYHSDKLNLPNNYYITLWADTDSSSRKVYFDWIKVWDATFDPENGYKKTELVFYDDFNSSDSLNKYLIINNPPHQIGVYDGRTVLVSYGRWNENKYSFILNNGKHFSGIKIIEVRVYIPESNGDYDAGILISETRDLWSSKIIEALADNENGNKYYHFSHLLVKNGNSWVNLYKNGWDLRIHGWFTGKLIYDSISKVMKFYIPTVDYAHSITFNTPEPVYIGFSGDTDSTSRFDYIDWVKIYSLVNTGSVWNPEYKKDKLLYFTDFNSADNLLKPNGYTSYSITTFDGVSVLKMWGDTKNKYSVIVNKQLSDAFEVLFRGWIGYSNSDYDLSFMLYNSNFNLVTLIMIDNTADNIKPGSYPVINVPSAGYNSVIPYQVTAGWFELITIVDFKEHTCKMLIPKTDVVLYNTNCFKVWGDSDKLYWGLVADTETTSRLAFVKSISVVQYFDELKKFSQLVVGNVESK